MLLRPKSIRRKFFFSSVPARVQTNWEPLCLVSPSVPAAITVLQAAGERYVCLRVPADAIPHGVIWLASSGVTSRELSSEKSAGSQYCASLAAWESNQAKPSFSRWSWEHKTDECVCKCLPASIWWLPKGNEQKCTHQDVTSSLLLPFEAIPDLTYCHITLFLKTNKHMECDEAAGFKINLQVKQNNVKWRTVSPQPAAEPQCGPCWAPLEPTGPSRNHRRGSFRSRSPSPLVSWWLSSSHLWEHIMIWMTGF